MGVSISHGCWLAPASKFMRFRRAIGKAVGIPIDLMDGYWDPSEALPAAMEWAAPREGDGPICGNYHGTVLHRWISVLSRGLPLKWEVLAPDPLLVLLNHPDHEGKITPRDGKKIAKRLREIAPLITEEDFADRALKFAEGLELAARSREPVTFSG